MSAIDFMRRSIFILCGALALGGAVFAGSFFLGRQICAKQMANPADNLDWLCCEFQLDAATMARVRELHAGYQPKCAEMCARIAAKKQELESALAGSTNVSPAVEAILTELGELRAQCQAQMLKHFVAVSQAMPPEQGRRYLAEMRHLTLGVHEQIEQSMSEHAGHEHHHD
jgi:small-conductance mechanosensitive channel